jgi:NADPH-dependent 2,4-dienoyl-CoA reductase/sulfur reductase-like enzyme
LEIATFFADSTEAQDNRATAFAHDIFEIADIVVATVQRMEQPVKCIIIGAGPVGALAALYAARRGWDVDVYELRGGAYVRLRIFQI